MPQGLLMKLPLWIALAEFMAAKASTNCAEANIDSTARFTVKLVFGDQLLSIRMDTVPSSPTRRPSSCRQKTCQSR